MISDDAIRTEAERLLADDELLPPPEGSIFWDLGDDDRVMAAWRRAFPSPDQLDDVQGYDDEWRLMLRELIRGLA